MFLFGFISGMHVPKISKFKPQRSITFLPISWLAAGADMFSPYLLMFRLYLVEAKMHSRAIDRVSQVLLVRTKSPQCIGRHGGDGLAAAVRGSDILSIATFNARTKTR